MRPPLTDLSGHTVSLTTQLVTCTQLGLPCFFNIYHLRSNCQHLLDHQKSKRVPEKHLVLLY